MDFGQFQRLIEQARLEGHERLVVPVFKRLSADLLTPVSAFLLIREAGAYPFLLESVEGGEKLARYSFIGKNPSRVVTLRDQTVTVTEQGQSTESDQDFFDLMQSLLTQYKEIHIDDLPRFTGGAVGFFSYDGVRLIEHLPNEPTDDLHLPTAIWCFYDTVLAFDSIRHQIVLISNAYIEPETDLQLAFAAARREIADLEKELGQSLTDRPTPIRLADTALRSNMTRDQFKAGVDKAKDYIYEGDIFQVVLSQRFTMQFAGDRFNLYRALRQVNPSPYLYYLDFNEFALIGSSPEVLVRVEDGKAELLPIAGTRPRGATLEEDLHYEADLLADPKEMAEHVMLVDLGRNDLGRVCSFETVQVERFAYIERYSHVMHIVSAVSGQLDPARGVMDVLAASFPAGTLSGAPKVRAMEIIDELEPTKRNIYGGAVGHLDFSGNMDCCIAIRTMVVKDPHIYIQAGAGIVADSDPDREFEETENKAQALKQAMLVAAEGLL